MNETVFPGILAVEEDRLHALPLTEQRPYTIGRADADLLLQSAVVSRTHGTLLPVDGLWFYCDAGSTNGTLKNARPIKPGMGGRLHPVLLQQGDVLQIRARSTPEIPGVWMLYLDALPGGQILYYPVCPGDRVTIGRHADNRIVLPEPTVSGHHALLYHDGQGVCLEDLHSTAGTRLNGRSVQQTARLRERDKISICAWRLLCAENGVILFRKT